MKIDFVPKGGMCATCVNRLRDCSYMDFTKMPPIAKCKQTGVVTVRCIGHEKGFPKPPTHYDRFRSDNGQDDS